MASSPQLSISSSRQTTQRREPTRYTPTIKTPAQPTSIASSYGRIGGATPVISKVEENLKPSKMQQAREAWRDIQAEEYLKNADLYKKALGMKPLSPYQQGEMQKRQSAAEAQRISQFSRGVRGY